MLHLKRAMYFLATACMLQSFPSFYAYSITPSELTSWVEEQKQCLQEKGHTDYTIEIFDFSDKSHLYAYEKLSGTPPSSPHHFDNSIDHFIARNKLFLHIKALTLSPFTSWLVTSKDDHKIILNIWEMDLNGHTRVEILGDHLYSSVDMLPILSTCVLEFLYKKILGTDVPVLEHPDISDLLDKLSSHSDASLLDWSKEAFNVSFKNFYVYTMDPNWETLKKLYHLMGFHHNTQKASSKNIFYTPSNKVNNKAKSSG